ncbi:MAG: protein kinase [Acidobacteria bacterium]|nr:protein kinase [Acidobacteriota bacterium]
MAPSPYVVGQWVRGERFYGRSALIDEALAGNRDWVWVCGTRRIGKTSLLKQLEWITERDLERGFLPLFWDLQGSADADELRRSFDEAILDAEELLEERGIAMEEVQSPDLFDSISRLRRRVRAAGLRLLLLCDEVEELIVLNRTDPALLRKLRRALQSKDDLRTIMASTIRLWALAEQGGETSPFLHGFTPPLYIQRMTDDDARALLDQVQAPAGRRPVIDPATAESIRRDCDNHPYLMQLVAKRFLEQQDLTAAIESVAADEMVSYFFSVDFDMLSPGEKNILRSLAAGSPADSDSLARHLSLDRTELVGHLQRLERLGYLRRTEERRLELPSYFFRRWLTERPVQDTTPPARVPTMPEQQSAGGEMPVPPARFDGRYRLIAELGRGATGVVYRAFDDVVAGTIAIKIIRSEYSGHPDALGRLRQEITLARDLGHPNILRVYHLGEAQGRYYITMQMVEGETLAHLMSRGEPVPLMTVLEIGRKLASALEAAHGKRILHRDIKPQNILLDAGREPYLTDFGLARLVDSAGLTESGVFVGTPSYASPEQANLRPLDERSDIYSFGTVLYEMASGMKPFEADDIRQVLEMHRHIAPPDPTSIRADMPPGLARIIVRCLEKDPGHRFQTAAELRMALQQLELVQKTIHIGP